MNKNKILLITFMIVFSVSLLAPMILLSIGIANSRNIKIQFDKEGNFILPKEEYIFTPEFGIYFMLIGMILSGILFVLIDKNAPVNMEEERN